MERKYYDSDFKPIRNKIKKYQPLDIANIALDELRKKEDCCTPPHPWFLFNIITWSVHFGNKDSKKKIDKKEFINLYNMVQDFPDDESIIERIKLSKDAHSVWWAIRSIFHQQKLYQLRNNNINILFILELSKTINQEAANFVKFVVLLSISLSKNSNIFYNKKYFKTLFDSQDIDNYWNIFNITEDKLNEIAKISKDTYKNVKFEKNSMTIFSTHPLFINNQGNLGVICYPVFKAFVRNGIYDLLIKYEMIERKKIEYEFERIILEYTKLECIKKSENNFIRPNSGVDGIIQEDDLLFFIECKSSSFHKLLPQYPTQEAHFSSLKQSVLKGYKQMLSSYRKYSKQKKAFGIIVTLYDLTIGCSIEFWKHSIEKWIMSENLNEKEIEFLKKYVWVINYTEYIEILHSAKNLYDIYNKINKALSEFSNHGSIFLEDYFSKNYRVEDIKMFGDNINEIDKLLGISTSIERS